MEVFDPATVAVHYEDDDTNEYVERIVKNIDHERRDRKKKRKGNIAEYPDVTVATERSILSMIHHYVSHQDTKGVYQVQPDTTVPQTLQRLRVVHKAHEDVYLRRPNGDQAVCGLGTKCETYRLGLLYETSPWAGRVFAFPDGTMPVKDRCLLCIRFQTKLDHYLNVIKGYAHTRVLQPWANVVDTPGEYRAEACVVDKTATGIVAPFVSHYRHRYKVHENHIEQIDVDYQPPHFVQGIEARVFPTLEPRTLLHCRYQAVCLNALNPHATQPKVLGNRADDTDARFQRARMELEYRRYARADEQLFPYSDAIGRTSNYQWQDLPDIVQYLSSVLFSDAQVIHPLLVAMQLCMSRKKQYRAFVGFVHTCCEKKQHREYLRLVLFLSLTGSLPNARTILSPQKRLTLLDHLVVNHYACRDQLNTVLVQETVTLFQAFRELFCFLLNFDPSLQACMRTVSEYTVFEHKVIETCDATRYKYENDTLANRMAYMMRNVSVKQNNIKYFCDTQKMYRRVLESWPVSHSIQPDLAIVRFVCDQYFVSLARAGLSIDVVNKLQELRTNSAEDWIFTTIKDARALVVLYTVSFFFYCREIFSQRPVLHNYAQGQVAGLTKRYDEEKYHDIFGRAYFCLVCKQLKTPVQDQTSRKTGTREIKKLQNAIGDVGVAYDENQNGVVCCTAPKRQNPRHNLKRIALDAITGTRCGETTLKDIGLVGYYTTFYGETHVLCTRCGVLMIFNARQVTSHPRTGQPQMLCSTCYGNAQQKLHQVLRKNQVCLVCGNSASKQYKNVLTAKEGQLISGYLCRKHMRGKLFPDTRVTDCDAVISQYRMIDNALAPKRKHTRKRMRTDSQASVKPRNPA